MEIEDIEPWERQPGESAQAYEAFQIFRDMGAKRRKQEVARQLEKSRTVVTRWAGAYRWDERASAWDRELEREWLQERVEMRRTASQRQIQMANALLSKVGQRLISMTDEQIDKLTPTQLTRMFDSAVRAQRDALGLGTTVDLHYEGEVTNKHELDLAAAVLDDPEAADLSLQLAERIFGGAFARQSGAASAEGDA